MSDLVGAAARRYEQLRDEPRSSRRRRRLERRLALALAQRDAHREQYRRLLAVERSTSYRCRLAENTLATLHELIQHPSVDESTRAAIYPWLRAWRDELAEQFTTRGEITT